MLRRRSIRLALGLLLVAGAFFAWRAYVAEAPVPAFSGERAMQQVRRQTAFGPRAPGSPGHRRARAYFVDTLRALATGAVRTQPFTYTLAGDTAQPMRGVNVIATFVPDAERRVLLAAHYDTRPAADEDSDPANRSRPILGANDGASGVAVLLELARLFAEEPPAVGVDLVLFDLEDSGTAPRRDTTAATPGVPFALGARHFARQIDPARYAFGILLDMVCDRNLQIPKEGHSLRAAPAVVEKVWAAAERTGASVFLDRRGPAITDDHVPLLERGVPMVDLIHAPFPWYWHTMNDTPAVCSAASLDQVGQTVAAVVYGE